MNTNEKKKYIQQNKSKRISNTEIYTDQTKDKTGKLISIRDALFRLL